jgi:release factor glutamine methyltransferase
VTGDRSGDGGDPPESAGGDGTGRDRPRLADRRELDTVYQPAEDSRLLADTAVEGVDGGLVCEVGVGSGYVARRVAEATGARVVGTDLNPEACRQAREAGVEVVQADLVAPFREGLFDAVLCNPPYLPTPPELEWDDPMEAALSGGEDGRAVVNPFLDTVGRVLAPGGVVFLLVSTLTGVDAVCERASAAGLRAERAAAESYAFEELVVLRMQKP